MNWQISLLSMMVKSISLDYFYQYLPVMDTGTTVNAWCDHNTMYLTNAVLIIQCTCIVLTKHGVHILSIQTKSSSQFKLKVYRK